MVAPTVTGVAAAAAAAMPLVFSLLRACPYVCLGLTYLLADYVLCFCCVRIAHGLDLRMLWFCLSVSVPSRPFPPLPMPALPCSRGCCHSTAPTSLHCLPAWTDGRTDGRMDGRAVLVVSLSCPVPGNIVVKFRCCPPGPGAVVVAASAGRTLAV